VFDVLRKIAAAGHSIGNHTHDQELLTILSHADAFAQIDSGARPKRVGYEIVDLPTYLRATAERPTPPHAVKMRAPVPALPSGA
jgi:peptidoglycan/xylan/chitin deacetylase (PgdA/CDA1 family)